MGVAYYHCKEFVMSTNITAKLVQMRYHSHKKKDCNRHYLFMYKGKKEQN